MRWLILLLLFGLVSAVAKNGCYVREFYGIGYTVHDPTERHSKMLAWLKNNAQYCKASDYIVMWNNLSEWAGSADSTWIRAEVIHGYKEAQEREKK